MDKSDSINYIADDREKYTGYLRISYISIALILVSFYIVYNFSLVIIGLFIPRLSIVVLIIATFCVLANDHGTVSISSSKGYNYLFVFYFFCFVTGLLFSRDRSLVITQLFNLLESLVLGYLIIRISIIKKSVSYLIYSLCITGFILAVFFVVKGGVSLSGGRYSISETINSNSLAVLLMFSVWALTYVCNDIKNITLAIVIMVVGTSIITYSIILTGSRKGLIGLVVVVVFWIIRCLKPMLRKSSFIVRIIAVLIGIGIIVFIVIRYGSIFVLGSTTVLSRLSRLTENDFDWNWKFGLIKDAIVVGLEHPIWGVGLNNYRLYSSYGLYAHNTFAECFACAGFIGSILFFTPYVFCGSIILFNKRIISNNSFFSILYLVYIYICFNQISIYNSFLMIIFYLLLSYSSVKQLCLSSQMNNK